MPRTASTGGRRDRRPPPEKRFCSARASIAAILHATAVLLASIPSPGDPFVIQVGNFDVRWYGLLLANGVLPAGWIAQPAFERRAVAPELVSPIALWVVPCGLVG